jgi:DNA-directed RNA polymerase specialized sigma subunit
MSKIIEKNIESLLKWNLSMEKEAHAAADAINCLHERHGGENALIYEFAEDLTQMHKKQIGIYNLISSIDDDTIRQIFTQRYINNLSWPDVAENCHISLAHVHRLHKKEIRKQEARCQKEH